MNLDYGYSPSTDKASMSALFRICTARVDREGDIIEPSGVDWSDYKNAPVVKYEHGLTGIPLPIAKSEDANGQCHFFYGHPEADEPEDAIYARAFFDDRDQLSRQMFHLVDIGFLKAASIHVLPLNIRELPNGGTHALSSSALEWSICTVGMNPDAFKKSFQKKSDFLDAVGLHMDIASRILSEQKIGGERLHPALMKSLDVFKTQKRAIVKGANMAKRSLTEALVSKLSPIALAKALANVSEFDANSVRMLRAKAKAYEAEEDDDEVDDEDVDVDAEDVDKPEAKSLRKAEKPDPEMKDELDDVAEEIDEIEKSLAKNSDLESFKPGRAFLHSVHSELKMLKARVDSARHATEDPTVLQFSDELGKSIGDALMAVQGAYAKIYKADVPNADEEEEVSEEMVKSWLADNASKQFVLDGLAAKLERGVRSPKSLKKSAIAVIRHLKSLSSQAKSYKKPASDGSADLESRVAKLAMKLEKALGSIENAPA